MLREVASLRYSAVVVCDKMTHIGFVRLVMELVALSQPNEAALAR